MSAVWVNGRFLVEGPNNKINKWKPDPPPEKVLWGKCPECGKEIYELESYWPMGIKFVCVWGGCWEKYFAQGIGYHAPAGLDFGLALEG